MSAGCKFRACPDKEAPLAFGVAPTAANVTSPLLVPERFEATIVPEKVLSPEKVWIPVVKTPPKVADAGCKFKTPALMEAPFTFGMDPIGASVVTLPPLKTGCPL